MVVHQNLLMMINEGFLMSSTHNDDLWYKDGIIYQVHVKAFHDSNNDGIGDFRGLLEKLDYIKNLGVSIIWLLPFYPSPLRDDGYDIADYLTIHPDYGVLEDFKAFLKEAHSKDLKVVTEMVLNHTSDQHPWFQKSRRSKPGSPERDLYVWSDTADKYKEARIIFSDFETSNWSWDPVANAYYWHRFYSHQPDLNFDNETVHKRVMRAVDFWFELGVDGLRLDAVPYLFEREGTNCENLPETHEFLKKLNLHVQQKFRNKMLLAEANQWPEDAVAYFGNGDECHMAFHFPLMPRIFMSIQMEDRFPITDILEQTPPIPENCQWAMFLRNHDELTLEMVTDEERDYMYRFYASESRARINLGIRRRLAPLVENNRRKIELLNILLFSFPGTPIVYYGDEIGMGDNFYLGDRNGVRTPMQWSPDRNAGFSSTNPQRLYLPVIIDPEYHYEAINVEVQQRNSSSLLWWMKKAISIRKSYKAFGRGTLNFLSPGNPKVLAFTRQHEKETILVVANLSRFHQVVELDLTEFKGYVPLEVFSRNKFPIIKDNAYLLTLGPYDYYWFQLREVSSIIDIKDSTRIPEISIKKSLKNVFTDDQRDQFIRDVITNYLTYCDWYHYNEKIQDVSLLDALQLTGGSSESWLMLLKISYLDRIPEIFQLAVCIVEEARAQQILNENPSGVIAKIGSSNYYLIDGLYDDTFRMNLIRTLVRKRLFKSESGQLSVTLTARSKLFVFNESELSPSRLSKSESQNINIFYNSSIGLKLYRKLEEGLNPGVEISRALSEKTTFENVHPYGGALFYRSTSGLILTLGLFREFVNGSGAWEYFKDSAKLFFENSITGDVSIEELQPAHHGFYLNFDKTAEFRLPAQDTDKMALEMVRILGKRTAEMHIALSSIQDDAAFTPEPFSILYQRSIYQSIRTLIKSTNRLLHRNLDKIPEELKACAQKILNSESIFLNYAKELLPVKLSSKKIRIHGNYHLRYVLFTGKDFVISNFEGNPVSALSERKLKRSPLRDVASMIWSFFFAANTAVKLFKTTTPEEMYRLESLVLIWWLYMSSNFTKSYYKEIKSAELLPERKNEVKYLVYLYLLEKMFSELKNGFESESDWLNIPLRGLESLSKYLK